MDHPSAPSSLRAVGARWVVLATGLLVVLYLLLPDRTATRALAPMAAIVGVTILGARRVRRTPVGRRAPWVALTAAIPAFALSDLLVVSWPALTGATHPWPGPAHLPFQVGLALLALAATLFAQRRTPPDLGTVLDALAVAVSLGVVVLVGVVGPLLREGVVTGTPGTLLLISHAAMHLVLVLAATRLAQVTPWRQVAGSAMVVGLGVLVATSIGMGTLAVLGSYAPEGWLTVGWILAAGALGVAATHPSADELTDPSRATTAPSPARRIAPHAVVALAPPAILLADPQRADVAAIALAIGVVMILITMRVFRLLRDLEVARSRDLADERARTLRRFEFLVHHAADVVVVVDPQGTVRYATPAAAGLFGADPTGWTIRQLVSSIHPEERRATTAAVMERLAHDDGRPIRLHLRLIAADGRELDADLVVIDRRVGGDVDGIVFTLHETTQRTQLESELRHLAFHDPLTGLPNRALFQQRLHDALQRSQRTGRHLAVVLCDLDDFKDVNDTLGHPAGDALLTQLGGRLSAQLRANDTLARIGGDEFAVLCEDLNATRDAVATAQRLIAATDEPFTIDGRNLQVGLSIGVAVDLGERTVEELFRDADIALYEAKSDGKRRWALHRAAMTAATVARRQLADDLVRAVRSGAITPAFQAIHALDDGRMVGVEALARWNHPVRGPIAPSHFVAMAEQTGLIDELGELVLDQTLELARRLATQFPDTIVRLGVNVSPHQLRDGRIVDQIAAGLRRHGLPAEQLVLELTESAMVEDADRVVRSLNLLREQGVRVALDDFGTGYSSLAYLRRLPVDIVKIDRAFVAELGEDPAAHDLIAAIIDLCSTLGLDVVAEGIEHATQYEQLRDLGVGFAQGFWLHRPGSATQLLSHARGHLSPNQPAIG